MRKKILYAVLMVLVIATWMNLFIQDQPVIQHKVVKEIVDDHKTSIIENSKLTADRDPFVNSTSRLIRRIPMAHLSKKPGRFKADSMKSEKARLRLYLYEGRKEILVD